MTDRPILFSGEMVRALLSGSKTQTRRIVKQQPPAGYNFAGFTMSSTHTEDEGKATWAAGDTSVMLIDAHRVRCPFGEPGDRLWVRETWRSPQKHIVAYQADGTCGAWLGDGDGGRHFLRHGQVIINPADGGEYGPKKYGDKWRPSIHMPRWASRITLDVTKVGVERLQDIGYNDCAAEGIVLSHPNDDGRGLYRNLWERINGPGSWAANPWVWVVEFKRSVQA